MLCGYGCGKKAKYPPRKGMRKWCCEDHYNKCSFQKKIKGELSKLKLKGRVVWNKGIKGLQTAWNKGIKNCWNTDTIKKSNKKRKITIEKIVSKYAFFSKIEEMRYNPDKPGEKEIQVRCKNHLCPNSKEQGGWFTPTYSQLYERIRALETPYGMIENNFYCSQECKNVCPLYYSKGGSQNNKKILYNSKEYKIFREFVLERDNYTCQFCGEKAEHVHHERPQKLEPFFALDPDYAWSCCKKCHYEKGHKSGSNCSLNNLSKKNC